VQGYTSPGRQVAVATKYLVQGYTSPGRQVSVATKYCPLACNLFGHLCRICFLSPFCRLSGF